VMDDLGTWKDVLIHLGDIIHPEVRKIYPRADAPEFIVTAVGKGVHLQYLSKRRLCHLAEGLVRGTGDWFSTPVEVTHLSCIQRGDVSCLLYVSNR
jgi:Haem-NO-binding